MKQGRSAAGELSTAARRVSAGRGQARRHRARPSTAGRKLLWAEGSEWGASNPPAPSGGAVPSTCSRARHQPPQQQEAQRPPRPRLCCRDQPGGTSGPGGGGGTREQQGLAGGAGRDPLSFSGECLWRLHVHPLSCPLTSLWLKTPSVPQAGLQQCLRVDGAPLTLGSELDAGLSSRPPCRNLSKVLLHPGGRQAQHPGLGRC